MKKLFILAQVLILLSNSALAQTAGMVPSNSGLRGTITTAPNNSLPVYNGSGTTLSGVGPYINSVLLTNGSGALVAGTKSGTSTNLLSAFGTFVSGHCIQIDSNGNAVDAGAACSAGGGGSGTVNSGVLNSIAYYASSGTAVNGLANASNGVLATDGSGAPSIATTLPALVQSHITTTGTITSGVWHGSGLEVAFGGTGLSSGVNGGILAFTGPTLISSSGVIGSGLPIIGGGPGSPPSAGSKSGNTNNFVTASGGFISGHCLQADASGNAIDSGGTCNSGSGTVNTGTINSLAYYGATGTAVSPLATAANGVLVTDGSSVPSISSTLPTAVQNNITSVGTLTSLGSTVVSVPNGGTGRTSFSNGAIVTGGGTGQLGTISGGPGTVLAGSGTVPSFTGNPSLLSLILLGSTSGQATLKVPATTTTYTFTLPSAAGTANQAFYTTGSGDMVYGTLPVAGGGTGLSSGTSGGIPYYSGGTTLASSAALSANNPVFGGGAGGAPFTGTKSGNTTNLGTVSGTLVAGNCLKSDASGNIIDSGSPLCGATGPIYTGTDGGTGNTKTITAPGFTLTSGSIVMFTATASNTGTTSANINSSGAKTIYKRGPGGLVAITGGDIVSGNIVLLSYDGTQYQIINPPSTVKTTAYNVNGTYSHTLTANISRVSFTVIGGGSGAGSGAQGGGNRSGGSAGGGGARKLSGWMPSPGAGSLTVVVGVGGAGGVGISSNGADGTSSYVQSGSSILVSALGGRRGSAGSGASVIGGDGGGEGLVTVGGTGFTISGSTSIGFSGYSAPGNSTTFGANGQDGGGAGGAAVVNTSGKAGGTSNTGGGGGGAGGGLGGGGQQSGGAGGRGGILSQIAFPSGGGGAAGGAACSNGGSGNPSFVSGLGGDGGGGGGSCSAGTAGNGGAGGFPGGAGGGGGAAAAGSTPGNGGAGADGLVIVMEE